MRTYLYATFIVCVVSIVNSFDVIAQNPVVQTIYTADPAPMVYKDTMYLYTGHDEDKSTWFTMKNWHLFSTTDMVNWVDRGSPLSLETFSWAKKDAWAGQCIERNGKFYWYVPVIETNTGKMAIGVAVSNRPTGPFVDAIGFPLISNSEIDPTVFLDDDGQAYLYYGNPNLFYVKLNPDMISYSGGIVQVPLTIEGFGKRFNNPKRTTLFEEAPWLYKRNNSYYMLYAAGGVPENIAYSTSKSPTGPWLFQDTIMPIQGGAFTNHEGVIDYKGHSYFFYHNGALPGGGGFTRSVCVEEFRYNQDGTIPTFNMTKEGPTAISSLNPYRRVEAETIALEKGVKTTSDSKTGVYVTGITSGGYIKVREVDFGKGAKSFEACVASITSDSNIEIHLDSPIGIIAGICSVKNSGGLLKWKIQSCKVNNVNGIHDVYFVFEGGEGDLFNFDWWKFLSK